LLGGSSANGFGLIFAQNSQAMVPRARKSLFEVTQNFQGFQIYRGQSRRFPIDFAGHRYNSAALPRSL